ncbi:MAG: YidC/Oxa1 family membrane protein insertase, partial [Candidatus Adiutrix sp.]|nr:YidC/Oxa1 family membrane protein insertase [Candidatus Adiutrix sp.]
MLSALYFIAIFPLEQIYKFLYIGFFRAFGDYGWALIGLSAIGAAIFYSLKKAAAALGKPLMGFRPSLEVLSQVPFLLAAYYMIEAFAPLRGQSCWLIADLRAPDALIGGLNLLPFLMTALNILAAFHVKKAARRERLQALVMAAVFLVVLYKGPSALLIYWIAVNLILWLGTRFANLLAAPLKNMAAGFSQRPVSLKIFKGLSRLNGLFDRLWDGRQRGVFAAATALIGALLFFYGPALIMTTSTFDVPTAEYELLSRSFYVLFVFWALGSFLLWSFCPPSMRSLLTLLYSLAALILSLNGLVFVGDYGLMEGPLFADTVDFGSLGRNIVRDLAVAGAAFLIIRLQGRKGFAFALFGIALVLTALSAVKMVGPIREHRVFLDNLPQEIEKEKEIFSYSPEGPNVIVMLLDGFDGEHVGKILDEYPDIKAQYKGFTWYPETLSPSRGTFYSVPSLWGGERLRFDKVYENGLEEAQAILASAYALVPDHFLSQGYKVLASWYGFDADLSGLSEKYGERFANKTTEAWEIADYQLLNNKKQAVVPHFLLGLSLFRSAPFVFKAPIYNQGRWLEGRRPFFAGAERENLQTVLSDAATNVGHEYRVVLERVLNQIELFK